MPIAAKKLATKTLRHQIVQQVRSAILNGSLRPGERLVERELAHKLGTSLTVAREAVIQLETEGLIVKRTNSTTHVTELSMDEVGQIFAVRRVLEEYAFVEAARHRTPQELAKLEQLRQKALQSAKAADTRAYIERDLAWHEAVWRMSQNDFLVAALMRTVLPLFGFSMISAAMQEGFNLVDDSQSHDPLMHAIAHEHAAGVKRAYQAAAETWSAGTRHEISTAGVHAHKMNAKAIHP